MAKTVETVLRAVFPSRNGHPLDFTKWVCDASAWGPSAREWVSANKPALVVATAGGSALVKLAQEVNPNVTVVVIDPHEPQNAGSRVQEFFESKIAAGMEQRASARVQMMTVEDLSRVAPLLAAEARKKGRTHAVLLPVESAGSNRNHLADAFFFSHESISEEVLRVLSLTDSRDFEELPENDPEETNRALQWAASDFVRTNESLIVALDATHMEGVDLPRDLPLVLLLNPETASNIDSDVLTAVLSRSNGDLHLILDLTAGSFPVVSSSGQDYYVILATSTSV